MRQCLVRQVWSGGDRGTRTPGLRIANAALSQLSYIPNRPRRRRNDALLNYSVVCDYWSRRLEAPGVGHGLSNASFTVAPFVLGLIRCEGWRWFVNFLAFPRSSVVERSTVNRLVVGSSPTAGAKRMNIYCRTIHSAINVLPCFLRDSDFLNFHSF